jgi:hypothetical protein
MLFRTIQEPEHTLIGQITSHSTQDTAIIDTGTITEMNIYTEHQ